jgi:fumarate hydratase subunit beta
MNKPVRLKTPLNDEDVEKLKAGDRILLNGIIYTGRDAAHKRLIDLLKEGKKLPFDIKGQIIYYVGMRSDAVKEAMKKHKAVYFAATGGAGALLAKRVKKAEVVAYEDLGPEAIRRLEVEDLPVIVVNDAKGNDLYIEGEKKYKKE